MNERSFSAQPTVTREAIIAAASSTFGEHGYRETTIKQIAQTAGVAAGSIYNHFASKQELFRDTVEDGWRRFRADMDALLATPARPLESLRLLLDLGFRRLQISLPLLRGMLLETVRPRLFQDNLDSIINGVARLLDAVNRERQLPPWADSRSRLVLVRTMCLGALFSLAITPDAELETTTVDLRRSIERLLLGEGAPPS